MSSVADHGDSETLSITQHREGCAAALTDRDCDCPPPRTYVALDVVAGLLRDRALRPECRRHDLDDAADFIESEFGAAS